MSGNESLGGLVKFSNGQCDDLQDLVGRFLGGPELSVEDRYETLGRPLSLLNRN